MMKTILTLLVTITIVMVLISAPYDVVLADDATDRWYACRMAGNSVDYCFSQWLQNK